MANDITTLAIALQSREAEANLKTFNELLTEGSDKAKRMERMTIAVDVDAAVRQLSAFKQSFDDIAASAQNIHFDLGTNMPMLTPPPTPGLDATALQELKAFFQESAEEMRRQSEALTESLGKVGASAETSGASVRTAGETMRGASVAAGEYAAKLREVEAAKKEMEKTEAKSEAAAIATLDADNKAADAKRRLAEAQRQLAEATNILNEQAAKGIGSTMERLESYEALKDKVQELKKAYATAQDEADKFAEKLEASSQKAAEAREKYDNLKAELAGIPAPTKEVVKGVDAFSKGAKNAGTMATKLARGFSSVARFGGASIPGLTGVGRVISMFSIGSPWIAGAILGLGALSIAFKKLKNESEKETQIIRKNAESAVKSIQAAKEFVSANETDWSRLGELSSMESLTNEQNQEATSIIERLTEAYGDLGIEIDKTTGKLYGYSEARTKADAQDRAYMLAILEDAKKSTEADLTNTLKNIKSKTEGWADTAEMNSILGGVISDINGNGSDEGKLRELQDKIAYFRRVARGEIKHTYTNTQTVTGSPGNPAGPSTTYSTPLTLDEDTAQEIVNRLEKARDAFNEAHNAKRNLEKFNIKPIEEYNQAAGKLASKLLDARSHVVNEDGVMRLKTENEIYLEQKKIISELDAEIASVNKKIEGSSQKNLTVLDNGKQAGIYLKELEVERTNMLEKTLTYEQRISAEKEKQRKALNDAIDAEMMRVNTFKSGYILNQNGGLVRQKNTDELAKDRTEDIKALQALISEKGYGKTLEEEKDLVAARLELARLEAEQLKYRDQVKAANEARANAAKGYVFDGNGAVLRKRTEEELNQERQKELADARKRVEAAEKGTVERAQAEAELTRLEIEAYNARKKTSAATAMNDARASNSRLVQGVEARSSAALALESRVFRRDDSEKAIMRDSKDIQTDIKDAVNRLLTGFTNFSATFENVKDLLQPL